MSKKQQLTPWFKDRKPWEVGVYQQKSGLRLEIGYQYWDGSYWHLWEDSPDKAERVVNGARSRVDSRFKNDPWRGLTKEQK